MIISVSRRTDIPAFYMDWFMNRLDKGYVLTRNPMNPKQISRISFSDVSCYVFWTKDPHHLGNYLTQINKPMMVHVTITPYLKETEMVKDKKMVIQDTIKLSESIGSDYVFWRYDPIMFSDVYTKEYHLIYFEKLCQSFEGHIKTCFISYLEVYKKIKHKIKEYHLPTENEQIEFAQVLKNIASKYGIELKSCGADIGLKQGSCIDAEKLKQLGVTGFKKDKNQRSTCHCIESVDIGSYNTCIHKCHYCYANYNHEKANDFYDHFDPASEILGAPLQGDEVIRDRLLKSKTQISLFD